METVAACATKGLFTPFTDTVLLKHLNLEEGSSIQYFDKKTAKWVTHLATSPAIAVAAGSVLAMKEKNTKVDLAVVVEQLGCVPAPMSASPSPTKRKKEEEKVLSDGVIDLTLDSLSPSKKRAKAHYGYRSSSPTPRFKTGLARDEDEEVEVVGSRPARISSFPAATVREMKERIAWIVENEDKGTIVQRYQKVFSCSYAKATYFRHQRAWHWLRENGHLERSADSDPWAPLVHMAYLSLDSEPKSSPLKPVAAGKSRIEGYQHGNLRSTSKPTYSSSE